MDVLIADVIGDVGLVLIVAKIFGFLARRCGQPSVVGQMIAGIMFGPSLLGRLPGHLSSHLFPRTALPSLTVLSQLAIVLFMFVAGYELGQRPLKRQCRAGLLVAAAALSVPMIMGSGAALVFRSAFAAQGQAHVSSSFILFTGVALSITALPVLAAITRERGIAGTIAGTTSMTAAGIMDVAAWVLLAAALVGTADKPSRPWPVMLLLICGFVMIMLLVVRPALRWWVRRPRSALSNQLPVALALALGSAWVTGALGLHPVFGGFLAGLTMPSADGTSDPEILRPMEEVGSMLLPLFFVVTGLSVNVGALNPNAFMLLAVLCAIASVAKLGPAYAASRLVGLDPHESATVAVLVNTRGLTELIALNVALSADLIGRQLFSIFVLMAVIMTVLTAPLLGLIRAPATSLSVSDRQPSPSPVNANDLH
jgi:Kef-type K+ transport system membrane component KefB